MKTVAGDLPPSAARVQAVLDAAGVHAQVVVLPQTTRTAADAAASIGCGVEQIAKSLVFRRGDGPALLVIASGTNRVDEKRLSGVLQATIESADAEFVRAVTGFVIGGVPPVAHETAVETIIDEDLLQLDVIWAAGGTPHAVFSLSPRDLVQLTGGRVMRVK